jgi:hypothetical protein
MGWKLSEDERADLRGVFERFEEREIRYVVLRRFDGLPERIPGETVGTPEVDLLVDADDYDGAVQTLKGMGFGSRTNGGLARLVERGVRNPRKAITLPRRNVRKFSAILTEATKHSVPGNGARPYHVAGNNDHLYTLTKGDLVLDLKSHLSHDSPLNGERIRLDPDVEEGMLRRRRRRGPFYTPAAPDELAHVLTHCVFEYGGEFTDYYERRCENLKNRLDRDGLDTFASVLSEVYYRAAPLAFRLTLKGEYDAIRPSLRAYADY